MQQQLTKKDFWDTLLETCPAGMTLFLRWIDDYKQRVNWNKIFPDAMVPDTAEKSIQGMWQAIADIPDTDPAKEKCINDAHATEKSILDLFKAPKFHDLPDAMQLGVFIQYYSETEHHAELVITVKGGFKNAKFSNVSNFIREAFLADEEHAMQQFNSKQ